MKDFKPANKIQDLQYFGEFGGVNPSICSIEKDPRIVNEKEEIALMILDELNKEHYLQMTKN